MSMYACLDDSGDEDVMPVKTLKKEDKPKKENAKENVSANKQVAQATKPAQVAPKPTPNGTTPKVNKDAGDGNRKNKQPKESSGAKVSEEIAAKTEPDVVVKKDDGGRRERNNGERRERRDYKGKGDRERRAPRDGEKGEQSDRPRREKREFDRRNPPNRNLDQRKDGRGAHSFGNVDQEAADAEKDPSKAEVEIDPVDVNGEGVDVEEPPQPEPEPVAPTLSLEEYLAKRDEARQNSAIFGEVKIRTVDTSEFEGVRRQKEVLTEEALSKKSAAKKTQQRSSVKAQITDVPIKFIREEPEKDTRRDNRRDFGRNNRQSGRGNRGVKSDRNSTGANLDLSDSSAFPSL